MLDPGAVDDLAEFTGQLVLRASAFEDFLDRLANDNPNPELREAVDQLLLSYPLPIGTSQED